MSSRHFRKVTKQKNDFPVPPDDSDDDDYQPLYTKTSGTSKFAGLEVSSSLSESDRVSERSEEEDISHGYSLYPGFTNNKKKNNKKNRKGKGKGAAARGVDEVERAQREVNAILGAPPPAPPPPTVNQALEALTVDPRHLNVANELKRIFGPDDSTKSPAPPRALLLKRVMVQPNKETKMYEFRSNGLGMMKYKEVQNRQYFVFNHDDEYQKAHRRFLKRLAHVRVPADIMLLKLEESKQIMHVEALLEISDRLFRMDEYGLANEILENVVAYLQYAADKDFMVSQNNVRLEYKFLENRPFHCAMLKYIYLLTNKACHRTALEIAKMMLLLDPHDPLAVISVIDVLALRCREHEWLIEMVKYFDRQREATLLFNIKYSYSLANYHVAHKNKLDLAEADRLIREAILAFPHIFVKILEYSHISNPELVGHDIFQEDPPTPWRHGANEVFMIYAKMTYPRWNEGEVMKWLMRNAVELCAEYNKDPKIRASARDWAISRRTLYQVWPKEYLRHLSLFSSISELIIDIPLTASVFLEPSCAFDPLYDKAVNRYEYSYKLDAGSTPTYDSYGNPFMRFFQSLFPFYNDSGLDE